VFQSSSTESYSVIATGNAAAEPDGTGGTGVEGAALPMGGSDGASGATSSGSVMEAVTDPALPISASNVSRAPLW
jgi:hypothetical protein